MFKLFITDTDLQNYRPTLADELYSTQSSYSNQINEAYHRFLDDWRNAGRPLKDVMIPLDLKGSSLTGNQPLVSSAETVSTTGTSFQSYQDLRRFYINVGAVAGTWILKVQGSNNNNDWTDITDSALTASSVGEQSVSFFAPYKFYRYSSSAGTSITYSAALYEGLYDPLIIYKTFEIVCGDFRRTASVDSIWEKRRQEFKEIYTNAFNSLKYTEDLDETGTIEEGEDKSAQITFVI